MFPGWGGIPVWAGSGGGIPPGYCAPDVGGNGGIPDVGGGIIPPVEEVGIGGIPPADKGGGMGGTPDELDGGIPGGALD